MSADTFFSLLAIGLSAGAAYALFALGYALVYSVLGLMNLAHGDVLMVATFASLGVWEATGSVPLALVAGVGAGAAVGVVVDQVAYRPLRFTGDTIAPLVSALGAALILRNVISSTFGSRDRTYPALVSLVEVKAGIVLVPLGSLAVLVLCLLVARAISGALERTPAGWVVQAVAQDITAARLVGLPVGTALLAVYAVSGAAAAIGGILYSSAFTTLSQRIGWSATVVAFTAAVLGGIGSLRGAVVGGVILGLVETFVAYLLPGGYREAVSFGLLVVVLLVRPTGFDRRRLPTPLRA